MKYWEVKEKGEKGGADALGWMFFTSGSTGKPKGVMVGRMHVRGMFYYGEDVALSKEENVLCQCSISFDAVMMQILYHQQNTS